MEIVFGRRDSRHLSASPEEGRRLRSAFDVFDFVNNAISSGVKDAKHTQKDILGSLGDAEKFLGPVAKDAQKAILESESEINKATSEIEDLVNEIAGEID